MRGHKVRAWERKLKGVFDQIDAEMESEYGGRYRLRPNRPAVGETSNPEADGIFDIGAVFSAGYGSRHGRGYIVKINLSTLKNVPQAVREEIASQVAARLEELLLQTFPDQDLKVERDGRAFKIVGDFNLD